MAGMKARKERTPRANVGFIFDALRGAAAREVPACHSTSLNRANDRRSAVCFNSRAVA